MREILHAELLHQGLDAVASSEGTWPDEVLRMMALEYEAALREHAPFSVLRIQVDNLDRVAAAAGATPDGVIVAIANVLRTLPRNGDLLALRVEDEILAVLTRTTNEEAEALARALVSGARKLTAQGSTAPLGTRIAIGLAFAHFEVGYWLEALFAVARDGVEVALSSGGGRVVHTELYGLHQKRLERESPDRPRPTAPPPPPSRIEPAWQAPAAPQQAPLPTSAPASPAANSGSAPAPRLAPVPPTAPTAPTALTASGIHDLEEKVLGLARDWTEEALAKALAEQQKAHSSEVDKLERRIQKLALALEEAQAELERAQNGAEIDPGVASAYRTVQGLRDPHGAVAKRDMLAKLFEANLELRTLLGRQS